MKFVFIYHYHHKHLLGLFLQPSYCLNAYTGHPNHVISLDFHPKKNDLFCFCDSNNEIRYWNINPFTCARVSKVGFCNILFCFTCLQISTEVALYYP